MSTPQIVPTPPSVDQKQVAEMHETVQKILEQARDLEITDNDDYLVSGSLLDRISAKKKSIMDFFDAPAKQANSLHKWITSLRGALLAPVEQSEELTKTRRKEYREEVERQRLAKEAAEREKAKEEADAAALEHAAELEAMGEKEAAEFVLDKAANAPPPTVVVTSTIPKEQGHTIRKVYKFRIKDVSLIKREFMTWDESKIKPLVDKLGPDAAAIVGGIEVYPDEIESVRRKK